MLKFVKHHMDSIAGIEVYPVISLIIFFSFFMLLGLWVFTYKKEKINELSNIPFNENN